MLARLLDVLFIDMWRLIGAHIGTDMTAFGADHLQAECPDDSVVGQVVRIHGRAMATIEVPL